MTREEGRKIEKNEAELTKMNEERRESQQEFAEEAKKLKESRTKYPEEPFPPTKTRRKKNSFWTTLIYEGIRWTEINFRERHEGLGKHISPGLWLPITEYNRMKLGDKDGVYPIINEKEKENWIKIFLKMKYIPTEAIALQKIAMKRDLMGIIEGDYDLEEKVERLRQAGFKKGENQKFQEIRRGIQEEIRKKEKYEEKDITEGNEEWILQTRKLRKNQEWKYLSEDIIANIIRKVINVQQYEEAIKYLKKANDFVQSIAEITKQDLEEEGEKTRSDEAASQEEQTDTIDQYRTASTKSEDSVESQIKQMTKGELRKLAEMINELLETGNTSIDDVTRAENEPTEREDEINKTQREKMREIIEKNVREIREDEKIEEYERHEGVKCRWASRNKYCPVTCTTKEQMQEHFKDQHKKQVELQERIPKEANKYRSGIPLVENINKWLTQSGREHEPSFRQIFTEKRMFYKCNEQRRHYQKDACNEEYRGLRVLHAHMYFCHKQLFKELPERNKKAFGKELERIRKIEKSENRYEGIPKNRKKEYKKVLTIMKEAERTRKEAKNDKPRICCPYFSKGCTEGFYEVIDLEEHMAEIHRKRTRRERKKLSLDLTKTPKVEPWEADSGVDEGNELRGCNECHKVFDIPDIGSSKFWDHVNSHDKKKKENGKKKRRKSKHEESSSEEIPSHTIGYTRSSATEESQANEEDSGSSDASSNSDSGDSQEGENRKREEKPRRKREQSSENASTLVERLQGLSPDQMVKATRRIIEEIGDLEGEREKWKDGENLEPIPDLSKNRKTDVNLKEVKCLDEFDPDKIEKNNRAREVLWFIRNLNEHLKMVGYSYEAGVKILRDRLKGEALSVMELYERELNHSEKTASYAQILQQLEKTYASEMSPEKCDQELHNIKIRPGETVNGFACRIYQKCEMAAKLKEPEDRAEWITAQSRKVFALKIPEPERTALREKNALQESTGKPIFNIEDAVLFLEENRAERRLYIETARSHKYGRNPADQIREIRSEGKDLTTRKKRERSENRGNRSRPYGGRSRGRSSWRSNFQGRSRNSGRPGKWQNPQRGNNEPPSNRPFYRGRNMTGKGGIRRQPERNRNEKNWRGNFQRGQWQEERRRRGQDNERGNPRTRTYNKFNPTTDCYKCGMRNHFASDIKCPLFDKERVNLICRKCNRGKHKPVDCPLHFDERMNKQRAIDWRPKNTQEEDKEKAKTQNAAEQEEKIGKLTGQERSTEQEHQEHQLNPLAEAFLMYREREL